MTFLLMPLAYAGQDLSDSRWEFAGWYGGGCYPLILPDPGTPSRVYLTSDVAGLWRSDERGAEWKFKTRSLADLNVATLAISASDPRILYAGTKTGLHRSTDAGETWAFLEATRDKITFGRPENYRPIAIDPADPDKIYAGTYQGEFFYSENAGQTWTRLGPIPYPLGGAIPISVLLLTPDRTALLAASSRGISRYEFSKKTWNKVNLDTEKVHDMVFLDGTVYATCGRKIARSLDGGVTWAYSNEIPATDSEITRIAVTRDKTGKLLLAAGWMHEWSGGVFLSEDDGKTWNGLERSLAHDDVGDPTRAWHLGFGKPCALAFDPYDANIIYFSDWWGVWRSDDRGGTWHERIKGAPNTVTSDIHISAGGDIFVATMDNGLLRSNNGGLSYTAVCPAISKDGAFKGHVWRVLCSGKNSRHVVATSSPWSGAPNQVVVSDDGGDHFRIAVGLPSKNPQKNTVWGMGYPRALAADPKDPKRIYLGIDGEDGGGLFYSDNGGYGWARSEGQPASLRIYNGLAVDPAEPSRIFWATAGDKEGGVYRSEDFGDNWTKVFSEAAWIFDLAALQDGTVYAAADARGPALYVSRDRGTRWELLNKFEGTGSLEAVTIDPKDPNRIAVSVVQWNGLTPGRIYLSLDKGRSWEDITGDLPYGSGASAMAFGEDGYLYAARYAGSVYRSRVIARSATRDEARLPDGQAISLGPRRSPRPPEPALSAAEGVDSR